LNRKFASLIAILLTLIVTLSLFLLSNPSSESLNFYVGVEYAYGNQVSEVKALVDKVKSYTNLFVFGSVELSFNETALNQACDYVYDANLNFIVLFTGLDMYNYSISQWMVDAKAKYSDRFLGIYRYDEPGGNQLDDGKFRLIDDTSSYAQTANYFVGNLSFFTDYYLQFSPRMFTSDYGLYWYDYQSNYTSIFAEFVGNQSRLRHISLCRGAADAFGKDWGVIVTWKYDQPPYLESGDELYIDLTLAYNAGAKYAIVFSYPQIDTYGTLSNDHFEALEKFWTTINNNPASLGKSTPQVAYVVPNDYGFGFRTPNDTIWGLFPADALSAKVYDDVNFLLAKYGANLDILHDGAQAAAVLMCYNEVYFWNQTIS
jgi:hypothetical protein